MKTKNSIYILLLLIATSGMWSCSTKKNTWATRNYHQTKTKYNIYHNGAISFQEGEEAIREANIDDYSTILNLYAVSNHDAAEASTSQMERTIEKCRKCIKLHSIKTRPSKINYDKKRKNPTYATWLEQEEFNNQIDNAWILLGMAEFHKGDFLGSVSTFNYITRHYANDPDVVAQCQLWTVRAYAEMGWLYEAEDVLNKVQVDNLSRKNAPLYSAVSADLMLKTKRYREAIPFIKIALPNESKKGNKPRFQYVLAQLYQLNGEKDNARNAYNKVLKLQPSNEMDFNARLNIAQLEKSPQDAIKLLSKMARLDKHKDQLDQIYGAIGDIYLAQKDTTKALEYYEKGIEKSTKHSNAKAKILVTAGDIHYDQRNYIQASPCYKEATSILSAETEQYQRIKQRSETLDELVVEHSMVLLQDSLQRLAQLSEAEQRVVVDSIIARLVREEAAEIERDAQAARETENGGGPRSVNTAGMLSGGGSRDWYFYNPQLLQSGKQTFRTQWGNRTLEDNWRRLSKATSSMMEEINMDEDAILTDSTTADSIQLVNTASEVDIHKPEYYLQQIPKTPADIAQSNELLARAMYNMVYIYRDRVGDQILADETFREFCKRFSNHELLLDLYYMQYLTALKNNNMKEVAQYSQDIQTLFPDSREAYIVSQPDYFNQLREMAAEQDSLYENTYTAYCNNQFTTVKENKLHAEEKYPLSPLMPRFLFLNAIAVAKTDGQHPFITQLQDMVTRYPDNELSAMAKDMLALLGQGAESQQGDMTSLQARRATQSTDIQEDSITIQFNSERNTTSLVMLIMSQNEQQMNQLLYDIALFNFSQFMIRDFDIKQLPTFAADLSALQISGFEKMDDAEWYYNMLTQSIELQSSFTEKGVQIICITQTNADLLGAQFTLQDYLDWQKQK